MTRAFDPSADLIDPDAETVEAGAADEQLTVLTPAREASDQGALDVFSLTQDELVERPWSPEQRLLAAVLLQALDDIRSGVSVRRRRASRWFGFDATRDEREKEQPSGPSFDLTTVCDELDYDVAHVRAVAHRLLLATTPTANVVRAADRARLASLEHAEQEPGRTSLDAGLNLAGDEVIAITARPRRGIEVSPDHAASQPRPLFLPSHRLLLAKLAAHMEDLCTPSKVKKRREVLAWVFEDASPASPDYVMSFVGICSEIGYSVERGRRAALRQAVVAELSRRQRLLLQRGRITLSLDPAEIEQELLAAARRILGQATSPHHPAPKQPASAPEDSTALANTQDGERGEAA
jgi:hypothetical protein